MVGRSAPRRLTSRVSSNNLQSSSRKTTTAAAATAISPSATILTTTTPIAAHPRNRSTTTTLGSKWSWIVLLLTFLQVFHLYNLLPDETLLSADHEIWWHRHHDHSPKLLSELEQLAGSSRRLTPGHANILSASDVLDKIKRLIEEGEEFDKGGCEASSNKSVAGTQNLSSHKHTSQGRSIRVPPILSQLQALTQQQDPGSTTHHSNRTKKTSQGECYLLTPSAMTTREWSEHDDVYGHAILGSEMENLLSSAHAFNRHHLFVPYDETPTKLVLVAVADCSNLRRLFIHAWKWRLLPSDIVDRIILLMPRTCHAILVQNTAYGRRLLRWNQQQAEQPPIPLALSSSLPLHIIFGDRFVDAARRIQDLLVMDRSDNPLLLSSSATALRIWWIPDTWAPTDATVIPWLQNRISTSTRQPATSPSEESAHSSNEDNGVSLVTPRTVLQVARLWEVKSSTEMSDKTRTGRHSGANNATTTNRLDQSRSAGEYKETVGHLVRQRRRRLLVNSSRLIRIGITQSQCHPSVLTRIGDNASTSVAQGNENDNEQEEHELPHVDIAQSSIARSAPGLSSPIMIDWVHLMHDASYLCFLRHSVLDQWWNKQPRTASSSWGEEPVMAMALWFSWMAVAAAAPANHPKRSMSQSPKQRQQQQIRVLSKALLVDEMKDQQNDKPTVSAVWKATHQTEARLDSDDDETVQRIWDYFGGSPFWLVG